jgi:hypothetical protein
VLRQATRSSSTSAGSRRPKDSNSPTSRAGNRRCHRDACETIISSTLYDNTLGLTPSNHTRMLTLKYRGVDEDDCRRVPGVDESSFLIDMQVWASSKRKRPLAHLHLVHCWYGCWVAPAFMRDGLFLFPEIFMACADCGGRRFSTATDLLVDGASPRGLLTILLPASQHFRAGRFHFQRLGEDCQIENANIGEPGAICVAETLRSLRTSFAEYHSLSTYDLDNRQTNC